MTRNDPGKIINFNLGPGYVSRIDTFIQQKAVLNRSCFMRDAIAHVLERMLVDRKRNYLSVKDDYLSQPSKKANVPMTVYLTGLQTEAIQALVLMGVTPSRSDFARDATIIYMHRLEAFLTELVALKNGAPGVVQLQRKTMTTTDMRTVKWPKVTA
jgi:Arc/MetJ-type ribon-helix-helix transcriptional regulator